MAKIEGLIALTKKLRAIPAAAEAALRPALERGAEEMADRSDA